MNENKKQMKEQKVFLDYLSDMGAWALGGAMFIYLGYRTLDFLTFTFRDEDILFAFLGLFSTTIGAVIFAIIWKRSFYFDRSSRVWRSDEFKKTVSMVMMIVCAFGELLLAVADMTLVTAQKGGAVTMTEGELKMLMWLTAGLAAAVGVAVASIKLSRRNPRTDPEIDMSDVDANNNGVMDKNEHRPQGINVNALETQLAQLKAENAKLRQGAQKEENPTRAGSQNDRTPRE